MIRAAGPEDRSSVEAFLLRHVDGAMFPMSNLRNHGLGRGDFATSHPHAMRLWWVAGGVVGLTRQGMLMPVLPEGGDPGGLMAIMAGLTVTGAIGPAAQVRAVLGALGLAGKPTLRNEDEPGFALDLAELQIPAQTGARLIAPGGKERDLLIAWRIAYQIETLGARDPELQAAVDVDGYLARDSHRVLLVDGDPVAMTGFNAVLPEIVQIGGVFIPPALRNQGYARLAVGLHLDEARQGGTKRAVLFAASAAAARAYQAIGFQPTVPVALVLFDGAQRVAA